ncbi:substrate-binding periplasmic protein [Neptuniibacter marinus]|uniref:substrate-binding periplasmic protein n=1 Tax=Neptuniibacter marinus TaxID=1806670 RepID=UPI00082EA401|nr:ABC transporter substrate-binding protein [Neptuniibacter marinus]
MQPIVLALALFITLTLDASADSIDPYGCKDKEISVGITKSGVMYHDGHGIDPDLLALLSDITHCQFHLIPIARNDAFNLVEQGKIDFVPSVTREPHREAFAWFIPYYQVKFLLLANTNKLPLISDLEQLKKKQNISIARSEGSGYGTYYNYHLSEMNSLGMLKLYPDYGATVAALLDGEVDAALSLPLIYRLFFAEGEEPIPLSFTDLSPANPITVSLMLGKHRFSSSHAANWLRVIETLRLDGRLQTIMEHYVSEDEANAMMLGTSAHHSN